MSALRPRPAPPPDAPRSALLSVAEAQTLVLARVAPLSAERVPLELAGERVLAEDVVAGRALPAHTDSAMDGYAVRAADTPPGGRLPVVGAIAAGDAGEAPLAPGTATRIFTGAPLPPGADAVIIQENTVREGDHIVVQVAVLPGENVRHQGSDVALGTPVLAAGRALSPGDLALLGALGRTRVAVVRAPTVAILASGDELVEPDGPPPRRGQVVASVGVALAAAVRALGGVPHILPVVPDQAEATLAALQAATRADVVLTIGGMSVGEHDHMAEALTTVCGGTLAVHKVAIKPGKPFAFGYLEGTHGPTCRLFGLPGNPVSALVTFEIFVRPALLALLGHARVLRRPVAACLAHDLSAGGGREEYRRATIRWVAGVRQVDARRPTSSGALASLAHADALLRVTPHAPAQPAGAWVDVLLLGPDFAPERLLLSGD